MRKRSKRADEYRVRFIVDSDAQFEECNGESRPLTAEEYADNEYMRDGKPIPYAEYLDYYGNPDRHVYLQSEVQKKCRCCGEWSYVAGTGGIDFMDDNPELRHTDRWFTSDDLINDTGKLGYLRLVGLEDLSEAGYPMPRSVRCGRKGCRYWHTADSRFCAQHQTA